MRISYFASILVAGLLCAGLVTAQDNKGPKIEINEMRYDFGKIVQGTQATHVFDVKNTGNEQLVIEKVQTS